MERAAATDDLSWINAKQPKEIPKQLRVWSRASGQKWIDGVTPEGWKIVGGSHGKWILGGKFHIITASTSSDVQTAWSHIAISGIDPSTGKAASWEFTSAGATSKITFNEEGTTIYGEHTLANGDENIFEGHFTIDGNVLRYKSRIGKKGEKPLPYGWNYHSTGN